MFVLQPSRQFDLKSCMTSPVLGIQAPAIGLSVLRDGNGMIGASRSMDNLAIDSPDHRGLFQDQWLFVSVVDDTGRRNILQRNAQGLLIDPAPCQALALLRHRKAVISSTQDRSQPSTVSESSDFSWVKHDGVLLAGTRDKSGLAVVVCPPGIHFAIPFDGEGVVLPGSDIHYILWESALAGHKTRSAGSSV
ncbi:hypothetical protein VTN31DRAFT_7437 [Thermomyces dupontii]|uniref:uncharacterized protein n=1 Tax=Talaromyces thermophilus TaxID=28565 RepID=UPI0037421134